MLLKLLLEVDKRVDRIAARTCVTWRSPWRRSVTTRCLFSLDTGHDTFSFSAAQLPPPPDGSRLENQCALTSTRMSVDVFIEFLTSPTGGDLSNDHQVPPGGTWSILQCQWKWQSCFLKRKSRDHSTANHVQDSGHVTSRSTNQLPTCLTHLNEQSDGLERQFGGNLICSSAH